MTECKHGLLTRDCAICQPDQKTRTKGKRPVRPWVHVYRGGLPTLGKK